MYEIIHGFRLYCEVVYPVKCIYNIYPSEFQTKQFKKIHTAEEKSIFSLVFKNYGYETFSQGICLFLLTFFQILIGMIWNFYSKLTLRYLKHHLNTFFWEFSFIFFVSNTSIDLIDEDSIFSFIFFGQCL